MCPGGGLWSLLYERIDDCFWDNTCRMLTVLLAGFCLTLPAKISSVPPWIDAWQVSAIEELNGSDCQSFLPTIQNGRRREPAHRREHQPVGR
jgi:hypothetical protein